ncbi:MAG: hypothetical protein LC620_08835 [Halobacteriales archaeon]|nr:hypothetical protein [Halobacteriales archaeon]
MSRRFGQALALAWAIRRRRPGHPDALVAEALSLIHEQRFVESEAVLEADGWTVALRPLRDYLRATAAAALGRRDEAVRRLSDCLRAAPEMAREAAANPMLAAVVVAARQREAFPGSP